MTATRDLDINALVRKAPDGESAWGERKVTLSVDGLTGNRILASLSSENPVRQKFGNEVLLHGEEDVDLSRVKDGGRLPLLKFHDQKQWPIGFIEGFRLDPKDKKTRGTVVFAEDDEDAAKALSLYRQGVPLDLSIGYDRDYETARYDPKTDTFYFRWKPAEVSVLPMGADTQIGFGRGKADPSTLKTGHRPENPMSDDTTPVAGTPEVSTAPVIDIAGTKRAHNLAKKAGAAEAIAGERQRIADVHELFDLGIVPRTDFYAGLRARAVDEGWPLDGARSILMQAMSGEVEPAADWATVTDGSSAVRVATHQGQLPPVVLPDRGQRKSLGGQVQQGADERDKFREGVVQGLLVRSTVLNKREDIEKARAGGFVGKSLRSLSGDFCRMVGINTNGLSDEDIAGRALTFRSASGATTSDFVNILANVANKSLLQGWDEAPETWATWTRRGTLPDFKTAEVSGISGFSSLDEIPEDGDIKYGKFLDRKETIKLVPYGKKYRLGRILIINDDLQALSAVPRAMGRAANRKVGDVTYALLDGAGPTLNQDGLALFHANHNNYVLAATAPTVATLNTATVAMARQTDPNSGATLNISPRFLLAPKTIEMTSRVLIAATKDPASTAGAETPNPFSGLYEVLSDARLDGQTSGTAAWYLLGDPNIFDTVEVSFLNGMAEPYMREHQEWDGQGVSYMIGVDCGVAVLDFRAIHKYRGS